MSRSRFEDIVDRCLDEITTGRRSIAECLDTYPEHRADLEPLLTAAFAVHELPRVPERTPDPLRRAALMAEVRRTPQQSRSRLPLPRLALPRPARPFAGLQRLVTVAAPAAAVAALALLLVLTAGPSPAAASTLTVFHGGVESAADGRRWQPVADGAGLEEGTRVRTTDQGHALITFLDGSTVSLAPSTEIVLDRVRIDGEVEIRIEQRSGRLWNDVASDQGAVTYVVVTPNALVEARGTVFETMVQEDGSTEVATAGGLVDVHAGEEQVSVAPGELVRAIARGIAEHRAAQESSTELEVRAPFVASLISEHGAATGARPNGVTFRQLPGVSTSDPGEGPQRIDLQRATPGRYTLLLRRFAQGSGELIVETPGGERRISVPDSAAALRLEVRVVRDDEGDLEIEVEDAGEVDEREAPERIVQTRRSERSVAVAERRQDASDDRRGGDGVAAASDDRDDRGSSGRGTGSSRDDDPDRRDDRDDDRGDGTGEGRPAATATGTQEPAVAATPSRRAAESLSLRLEDAIADGRADAAERWLERLADERWALSTTEYGELLRRALADEALGARLRALLSGEDEDARELRRAIVGRAPAIVAELLDEPDVQGARPGTATETGTPSPTASATVTASLREQLRAAIDDGTEEALLEWLRTAFARRGELRADALALLVHEAASSDRVAAALARALQDDDTGRALRDWLEERAPRGLREALEELEDVDDDDDDDDDRSARDVDGAMGSDLYLDEIFFIGHRR